MTSRWAETVQKDVKHIGEELTQMAALGTRALQDALRALLARDRTLAYSVIIRDQKIDALERINDRLCLDFLVREQPAASLLRFVYGAIRINLELERVGDYAESIARQVLKLLEANTSIAIEPFEEICRLSTKMLEDAVCAFTTLNADLARKTIEVEDVVDGLKSRLNRDMVERFRRDELSFEELNASMMIARRLERVSDQARNICREALYVITGEYTRHGDTDVYRLLFIESRGSARTAVARAVAERMGSSVFEYSAASLDPAPLPPSTVDYLRGRGADPLAASIPALGAMARPAFFHVVVALDADAQQATKQFPRKTVFLNWHIPDPSESAQPAAAHPAAADAIERQLRDLVHAIEGTEAPAPEGAGN